MTPRAAFVSCLERASGDARGGLTCSRDEASGGEQERAAAGDTPRPPIVAVSERRVTGRGSVMPLTRSMFDFWPRSRTNKHSVLG